MPKIQMREPGSSKITPSSTVFLIHGLTAEPSVFAPIIAALHRHHISAECPLIAGHGTSVDDLGRTSLAAWIQSVEKPFLKCVKENGPIVIGGLSLGGLLALDLAARYPKKVKGVIAMATPVVLPLWLNLLFALIDKTPLRYVYSGSKRRGLGLADSSAEAAYACYDFFPLQAVQNLYALKDRVCGELPSVSCPVLAIHSKHDGTVPFRATALMKAELRNALLEIVALEKSDHVITLDFERELVASACVDFVKRLTF